VEGVELVPDEVLLLSVDEVLAALSVDFVSEGLLSPSPALIAARIDLEA
jgi:hypothetical protein